MRESDFALWLQPSLLDEARKVGEAEGVALAALRTASYSEERRGRADIAKARDILARTGTDDPPVAGDEMLD